MAMEFKIQDGSNDSIIVAIIGTDLDMMNVKVIKERLFDIAVKSNKNIELDLSVVTYVDSSGVGTLIGLQKLLQKSGRKLYIKNANSKIENVLESASLSKLFHMK
jgi:anti-anti-sigma factor